LFKGGVKGRILRVVRGGAEEIARKRTIVTLGFAVSAKVRFSQDSGFLAIRIMLCGNTLARLMDTLTF
jgi:hypothetical protein